MRARIIWTEEQVSKRVSITPAGCWEWMRSRDRMGYGRVNRFNVPVLAHRFVYELLRGTIPPGMRLCHRCDNPPCVNPDHMFIGTDLDNMHDMIRKGRSRHVRGEKSGRARVTEADVVAIRALRPSVTVRELANMYGVSRGAIGAIINRRSWTHL